MEEKKTKKNNNNEAAMASQQSLRIAEYRVREGGVGGVAFRLDLEESRRYRFLAFLCSFCKHGDVKSSLRNVRSSEYTAPDTDNTLTFKWEP